jgi:hypothetical protein
MYAQLLGDGQRCLVETGRRLRGAAYHRRDVGGSKHLWNVG